MSRGCFRCLPIERIFSKAEIWSQELQFNYKFLTNATKQAFSIHNYFFAKALDQVRPGGIVAFVTSRYTLDSKDSSARKHIAERADLLGTIRLPNNAFKANAGTEVVSDIIFLQKRDRPIDHEPDWVQLGKTEDGFAINQYFVDHPEMVLGELTSESTQYGREECTVRPIEGAVLADQLAEAIQHIEGQYAEVEVETPDIADAENEKHILPADPDVKNFSYTVVDGEVYYRENSVMTQVELSDTAKGRVTGMVELRQIVNELIDQQLNDYPDADIQATQDKLNTAYDAFSAKYGLLNDRKNGRLFEQDSSYYLLCSLENLDEQGQLKSKAAMFTKRTIRPEHTVTNVDTPTEALAVSIGEHGRVDLPYMAELLGTPGDYERITSELSGVIFKDPGADPTDPEAGWQMADEYLSGNVRAKLRIAQLAAETNPEFAVNVTALEKAQPKDLEASEIDVRLGATWLAPEIIQKFMAETFQIPYYLRHAVKVRYSPYTAEWRIEGKSAMGRGDITSTETYGTSRANAYKILEDTLNLKDVRISGEKTCDRIAKENGVNRITVIRAEKFANCVDEAEKISPGSRQKILSGTVKGTAKDIMSLARTPPEERSALVEKICMPKEPKKFTNKSSSTTKKKKVKKKQPDAVEELSCSVETIPAVIEEPPKPQKALTELQTIRVLSNKMESVEQVADAEGMLSEVESAADAMIYRLDVCFEHYPEFLKNPNIRQKVVELLQKAKAYIVKLEGEFAYD